MDEQLMTFTSKTVDRDIVTFEKIAEDLGVTKKKAVRLYLSGMNKLRVYVSQHPELREYLEQNQGSDPLVNAVLDTMNKQHEV